MNTVAWVILGLVVGPDLKVAAFWEQLLLGIIGALVAL